MGSVCGIQQRCEIAMQVLYRCELIECVKHNTEHDIPSKSKQEKMNMRQFTMRQFKEKLKRIKC